MTLTFSDYIAVFKQTDKLSALAGIGRGIEREALRVLPEGKLSQQPHRYTLGSALTHDQITTDYSETLLEFITPVSTKPEFAINQLRDIQKYVLTEIDGELLWPMSMPCFVNDADDIQIAQYGNSNIGRMKTVYRQGLKNRYGSMMQVIAGIHFNFSFSTDFWQTLSQLEDNKASLDDFISAKYFALIRNYKRFCWLIPYLFGSSPLLCRSFLEGKKTDFPFETSDNGYLYLPYATSLRMSDLGYTNNEQSSLYICYNSLSSYVSQVQEAMTVSSDKFSNIGVKVDGKYQQLNTNVLQIENELYAPIRPKRVTQGDEKPSEALQKRGVEYIEVRALDVNPFSDVGISLEQVQFLDIFLTYCALKPSAEFSCEQQAVVEKNMDDVVLRGRDPALRLKDNGVDKSIAEWGEEIFTEMTAIAELLDQAYQTDNYQQALTKQWQKIKQPELTPSAQLIKQVVGQGKRLTALALELAEQHRADLLEHDYQFFDQAYFEQSIIDSHQKQREIEQADNISFDGFLANYFAS